MKNYSKEFRLRNLYISIGTHWEDWALPLRISWYNFNKYCLHTIDIFIDILCFTISVEILREEIKNEN